VFSQAVSTSLHIVFINDAARSYIGKRLCVRPSVRPSVCPVDR